MSKKTNQLIYQYIRKISGWTIILGESLLKREIKIFLQVKIGLGYEQKKLHWLKFKLQGIKSPNVALPYKTFYYKNKKCDKILKK